MRRELLSARVIAAVRLFFVAIGIVSLVVGYSGLARYVHAQVSAGDRPAGDASVSNLIYYDAELFLLQSTPLSAGGTLPVQLQIARFSAPSVALYTFAELAIALSATRLRRARLRHARGHAVVCGSTRAAEVLADRLRTEGTRVIAIKDEAAERSDRDTLVGDPRVPRTLLAAGVDRAVSVYACLELGEENAQIADAAARARKIRGRPERIHMLVPDLELCAALRARRWSLAASRTHHLGFFNPEELAAQAAVRKDDAAFADVAPRIAVVGTAAFGCSILLEFARQWVARGGARHGPVQAVLIGPDSIDAAAALRDRYAFLAEACDIEPRTEDFGRVLAQRRDTAPDVRLRRLYLCHENESEMLKAALDVAAHLHSTYDEVVVRLDRMTGMAAGFWGRGDGGALLDALGGRLRVVDVTAEGCDPQLIDNDLAEWMARACHQRYLADRLASGAVAGSAPSLVRWEELSEEYRAANRDQAADIGRKLAAIDCLLSPRRPGGPPFDYRDGEVERLAELEHERWGAERRGHGWAWGPRHDEAARRHPDLVPWRLLPEQEKDKDRQAVRSIPAMLADAGLAIIRSEPCEARNGAVQTG